MWPVSTGLSGPAAGMNSEDLRFFSLVATAGSISDAALASGCDASTISRRISQLERVVGTRLFVRSGRGVTLTPQGQELRNYAQQVHALLDAARAAMSSTRRQGPARIRIGAQPTIAKLLFGELFHRVRAQFPETEIHFIEGMASRVLADLRTGQVDLAVLYKPEHPGNLECEALVYEQLCLLTPPDSSITQEQVRKQGLAGIPLILPSTHHGLRVLIQEIGARSSYAPHIVLQSDSGTATTLELVASGCGCTVKPLAAAEAELAAGRIRAIALEGADYERCIALVFGKTEIAPADLWAISGVIRDVILQKVGRQAWPGARLAS